MAYTQNPEQRTYIHARQRYEKDLLVQEGPIPAHTVGIQFNDFKIFAEIDEHGDLRITVDRKDTFAPDNRFVAAAALSVEHMEPRSDTDWKY